MSGLIMYQSYAKSKGQTIGQKITDSVWIVDTRKINKTTSNHIKKLLTYLVAQKIKIVKVRLISPMQNYENFNENNLKEIIKLFPCFEVSSYEAINELKNYGILDKQKAKNYLTKLFIELLTSKKDKKTIDSIKDIPGNNLIQQLTN